MFKGYFRLGGTEVVNSERTYRYVKNNMPQFPLKDCDDCEGLGVALGDEPYESPLHDDAPWVDERNRATYDFYGFYPLSLSGTLDDTREAETTEGILDGGTVGQIRHGSREMRYRGLLIAKTPLALHAGMTWFKAALAPSPCNDHGGSCGGATACFFAACPEVTTCYHAEVTRSTADNPTGSVSRDTPFSRAFRGEALAHPEFRIPETEGAVLRWGTRRLTSQDPMEAHGPIISRRVNVVVNPRFAVNTSTWVGANRDVTRHAAGAMDGGSYATIGGASVGSAGWVEAGPLDSTFGENILSVDLRGNSPITISLVTFDDGVLIASMTVTPGSQWKRYYLPADYGRRLAVKFRCDTAAFDVSRVLIESGNLAMPYFDGSTAPADPLAALYASEDADLPTYEISWAGPANASKSVMRWAGYNTSGVPAGQQRLGMDEPCDPEFRIFLEVLHGSLPWGVWDADFRDEIPVEEQVIPFERNFHDVTVTSGPTIIQEFEFDTGYAYEVDFVFVAGTPFAYGTTDDIMEMVKFSTLPTVPWVDVNCAIPPVNELVDPDCPPVPAPPRPPAIPALCLDETGLYQRYVLSIPGERISGWSQMLPTIVLNTLSEESRQVRVRFTPNPFGYPIAPTARTNLHKNPTANVNTSGWASTVGGGTGGAATLTRVTGTDGLLPAGVTTRFNLAVTAGTGTTYLDVNNTDLVPVVAGKTYSAAGYMRSSIVAGNYAPIIQWLNSGGGVISASNAANVATTAGVFKHNYVTAVAPAGAVNAKVYHRITGAGIVNGTYIQVAATQLEQSTVSPLINTYFDGSSTDASGVFYSWTGAEGASTSLAVRTSIDPCGYCSEFILSYLPANAELTIDGLTRTAFASVAGGPAQPASQLLYGTDGVPMTWPELSCGIDYVMTVDVPVAMGDIAISLALTVRE